MKVTVLGAGMVGSAIAVDLAQEPELEVAVADVRPEALDRLRAAAPVAATPVATTQADLRAPGCVGALVAESDMVISAVPGYMGFNTLREVIEAGKDVVDIAFFAEDPFLLDEPARARGVTAVTDCGVAPGLCNIIAGYVDGLLDQTERYVCYVGGLPRIRQWPFEYKAVFSPVDVLQEYVRPARLVEGGREVVRPALSDVELVDLPGVGTLEAFNTDGLRTLCRTLDIPSMREKTLRYPGHANLMRVFRESGFFSEDAVTVDGQEVVPMAVTSHLLFEQWRLAEGEADFTVMQVVLEGQQDGAPVRYTYNLLDHYDAATRTTSMARTTGYTCAIVARQLLKGLFRQPGICPPEYLGPMPGCYDDLLAGYARRGIRLELEVERSVC